MVSYRAVSRSKMTMQANLWTVSLLMLIIAIYVIAKIRHYMRVSDEQWRRVDKSKLMHWEDDED